MTQTWPVRLLEQLELVDTHEAPHGLYGIRRAYAPEGPLPSAAHVLGSAGKAGLPAKCGFRAGFNNPRSDTFAFTAGGEAVSLQVLDYATTKIRHFGTAFRLDKHPGKPAREPAWDLETLVPKLRRDRYATHALLLLAHTMSPREIEAVLGKTTQPEFLDRYHLAHHVRDWDDRYGRGFRTTLHLWVPRHEGADAALPTA